MKLTIAHRFHFETVERLSELGSPHAWDVVRAGGGTFGLPDTRDEWLARAARAALDRRAVAVIETARGLGADRLCSYGVGAGYLELKIAERAPDLSLVCTDFAPNGVARLSELFPEAVVVPHDLLLDEPLDAELHLLHRLDTEFSNGDWPAIFARFRRPMLFVATELLGPRSLLREAATRLRHPQSTHAGWVRTEDALRGLWSRTHDDHRLPHFDLPAYLLTPKR